MNPIVATAIEAARAANGLILARFHGDFTVEIKADDTPVTIADREAEQAIRAVIREHFPEHGIYGEEYGQDRLDADYLWLIDPIDGTKSFVRGTAMFSTQIAVMHDGHIVAGVSNAPAMDELAWAAAGAGAWLGDRRLGVSSVSSLRDAHVSTGNLVSLAGSDRWPALGRIVMEADRFRGYGDFYHYHRLAAGELDAVIESDVNVLDIAALSLLVTEAGGVFTDLEGCSVGLETRSVLAATPELHPRLLEMLNGDAD